jgi:hypothetical protein
MKRNVEKTTLRAIFLVLALAICWPGPLGAADKPAPAAEPMDPLVVAMSTDDTVIFDGAITIATVALKRGHPVTMLLRLNAIKAAVAKNSYPVGNTTLSARLSAFMGAGGTVIAGGSCIKQMGLSQGDLIRGVIIGTPDIVMGTLFRKDTKILSY